jgi:hypothetical protein
VGWQSEVVVSRFLGGSSLFFALGVPIAGTPFFIALCALFIRWRMPRHGALAPPTF